MRDAAMLRCCDAAMLRAVICASASAPLLDVLLSCIFSSLLALGVVWGRLCERPLVACGSPCALCLFWTASQIYFQK
jgi:hypothetical protein